MLIYVVESGDTLSSIAEENGTTIEEILSANGLATSTTLVVGQALLLPVGDDIKIGTVEINGYAYPFIERDTLTRTLPDLTYISLFSYGITNEGNLIPIDDEEIIQESLSQNVVPLLVLTTLTKEGVFSNDLASIVLHDQTIQNTLIEDILATLKEKGYYGVDVDFEFVYPSDRVAFVEFIKNITNRLNAEGYVVFVALAPKVSSEQKGLLYEAHDYGSIGAIADAVLLMTYEWGYTYGPPMAVAPIDQVRRVLDYGVTQIPTNKIFMGIPNYGYDWTLPFVQGESKAENISNVEAVERAAAFGVEIQFDEIAQSPFYEYTDAEGNAHIVWFEDARSINAKLRLIQEYGLRGAGYWTIMNLFPQNSTLLHSLYDITKVVGGEENQ